MLQKKILIVLLLSSIVFSSFGQAPTADGKSRDSILRTVPDTIVKQIEDSLVRQIKDSVATQVRDSVIAQIKDSIAKPRRDTSYWQRGSFAAVTFNQVKLTNWKAGGENALSVTTLLNLYENYRKDRVAWDNNLDLGYGLLKAESKTVRKNEDKIDLQSKFGYKAIKKLYYTAFFGYRTQFTPGYRYPTDTTREYISNFNAPGYFSVSLGLDYKPSDHFSLYFSPAAGKFTIVADKYLSDLGSYGVPPGKKVRSEFGASLNARFQKDIRTYLYIVSKLALFNNYTDVDKSNRANIDVNWEVMINIKAGKFLTTSIITNLIYDHNVIKRIQFKEVLGVGVSYKF
jgi:hypothetical protein